MISDRPTPQQMTFDFGDEFVAEATAKAYVEELQRGQSVPAIKQQPALVTFSVSLMEKLVDRVNMKRA